MHVVINGWFSGHPVGSGRYTDRLIAELRAAAAPGDVFELVAVPSHAGRLHKLAFEQVGFPLACRAADVAHVPYWAPPLVSARPTVVTVHDLIPLLVDEYRRHPSVRAYTALVTRATRRAAAVITDSAHTAADIATHLGIDLTNQHVVPLGVDPSFTPCPPEAADRSDRTVRMALGLPNRFGLYLGGFDQRKNLPTLLAAWRTVYRHSGVPLVIAGAPPRPNHPWASHPANTAAAVGLPDEAMRLLGHVDTADLPALYRAAAVFAYPSRYEGFGLPPLEAMACGTPVVVARATSLPEVVGEAGLLVDPDDVDAWAAALATVLEDPAESGRLRHAGPLRAQSFTWAETARRTRLVYETVGH